LQRALVDLEELTVGGYQLERQNIVQRQPVLEAMNAARIRLPLFPMPPPFV
jgi:hypothetical protein